jgi:hypothetical protein
MARAIMKYFVGLRILLYHNLDSLNYIGFAMSSKELVKN